MPHTVADGINEGGEHLEIRWLSTQSLVHLLFDVAGDLTHSLGADVADIFVFLHERI